MTAKRKRIWRDKDIEALAARHFAIGSRAAKKVWPEYVIRPWRTANDSTKAAHIAITKFYIQNL